MELITLAGLFLLLLIPLWIFTSKRDGLAPIIDKIPGPLKIPVLGTAYKFINMDRKDVFPFIDNESRKYWPLFRMWNGSLPEIHICDADYAELILSNSTNIEKARSYEYLHPWLGTGLLTSKGQKWHSHRKLITPAFHFKILENFLNVFVEKSEVMVKKLEKEVGNTTGFDAYPYITLCALDIICETAMGTEINMQQNADSPYVSAIYEMSDLVVQRIFKPWLSNDFIYSLTNSGKVFKKDLDIIHSFTDKVIQEKKRYYQDDHKKDESHDDAYGKKRMAFLDLLLEASQGGTTWTEEELREEVDTFMQAGFDTTSTSLCWVLFLLGNHPDIQERVYEELHEIFQGSDRPPTMHDLAEMKYLERVIKESLRIYPTVPFIGRKVTQEVKAGPYIFPVGIEVSIHIYHVHRNPKYYSKPDEFNPDNFLPEKVQGRHPYAYIPFSAGSRNCVGQKFALLEEKTILCAVLKKYRIRSLDQPKDIVLLGELVLRPANGVRLVLEKR